MGVTRVTPGTRLRELKIGHSNLPSSPPFFERETGTQTDMSSLGDFIKVISHMKLDTTIHAKYQNQTGILEAEVVRQQSPNSKSCIVILSMAGPAYGPSYTERFNIVAHVIDVELSEALEYCAHPGELDLLLTGFEKYTGSNNSRSGREWRKMNSRAFDRHNHHPEFLTNSYTASATEDESKNPVAHVKKWQITGQVLIPVEVRRSAVKGTKDDSTLTLSTQRHDGTRKIFLFNNIEKDGIDWHNSKHMKKIDA
ncbi:hypothetical protein B0J11DRAFT_596339 [Dendryphion nanum]|uniref:Uncharacterized protein n=1 Tax=Dendryphion nanum TaxID=256645 RepID=A0A9P9EF01_9PLEO|nr:hypothetical protein B0J11DRAFT_596339 [Dendryphion nanum]